MLRQLLLASMIFFGLTACQTMPGQNDLSKFEPSFLSANLKSGVTKKEEVLRIYGKPKSESVDSDGTSFWMYPYDNNNKTVQLLSDSLISMGLGTISDISNSQMPNKSGSLDIVFSKNGTVKSYNVSARER